jgi:hypothetical protein
MRRRNPTLAAIIAAGIAGVVQAQPAASQSKAAAPAAVAGPETVVAPQAERLLRQMSEYLGSADQFTVHAEIVFDHVLPSGQKLQFSAMEDVALQRPGKLYIEWTSDLGQRQFWYNGSSITLYDPSTPFYATTTAPADIDHMLDTVEPSTTFAPPLADFFYHDPYAALHGKIRYGVDLGVRDVGGRSCRALAFAEEDIDWQIWIDTGPQPTPCKIVITYKTHPSQPQFSATFSDWDFAPRIAPATFEPDLPPGTRKIPFATVGSAQ